MDKIAIMGGVANGPGSVTEFPQRGPFRLLDGPLRALVEPSPFYLHGGFTVGVYHYIHIGFVEALG